MIIYMIHNISKLVFKMFEAHFVCSFATILLMISEKMVEQSLSLCFSFPKSYNSSFLKSFANQSITK